MKIVYFLLSLRVIHGAYYYPEKNDVDFVKYNRKRVKETAKYVKSLPSLDKCLGYCMQRIDCLTLSHTTEAGKVECRVYNTTVEFVYSNTSFILRRGKISCSGYCQSDIICSPCKCQESCSLTSQWKYHCNCTKVLPIRESCQEYYDAGLKISGVYAIKPGGKKIFHVFCKMELMTIQNPTYTFTAFTMGNIEGEETEEVINQEISEDLCTEKCLKKKLQQDFVSEITGHNYWTGPIYAYYYLRTIYLFNKQDCYCVYGGNNNRANTDDSEHRSCSIEGENCVYKNAQILSYQTRVLMIGDVTEEECVQECSKKTISESGLALSGFLLVNRQRCSCVYGETTFSDHQNNMKSKSSVSMTQTNFMQPPTSTVITMMVRRNHDIFFGSKQDYITGFGSVNNLWIGLTALQEITTKFHVDIRADYSWNGFTFSTLYRGVNVGDAATNYKLSVQSYDRRSSYEPNCLLQVSPLSNCAEWWEICSDQTNGLFHGFGLRNDLTKIELYLITKPKGPN